jgi:hypothetical protein
MIKISVHVKSDKSGGRMFLNLVSLKPPKKGVVIPKTNWRLMVDESTNFKIADFYKKKYIMWLSQILYWLNKWKINVVKLFLPMDNAGENQLLEKRCKSKDWQSVMEFGYTARAKTQQNHMAELGFSTLGDNGRALILRPNIPVKYRYHFLLRESFSTATDLDVLVVMEIKGKRATRYEHIFGKNPAWAEHFRAFGEAGNVNTKTDTTPKLYGKGVQHMFVGYA